LLPAERRELMPDLWRRLRTGGYMVVTETPWRWFPIETHCTSWPLVNYMPDRVVLAALRRCGRFVSVPTWNDALRQGARGATLREIMSCLAAPRESVRLVRPSAPDARDMLESWWRGESRPTRQKAFAYRVLRGLERATGLVVSPWLNFVLQKIA
jgi:hypothetical protein